MVIFAPRCQLSPWSSLKKATDDCTCSQVAGGSRQVGGPGLLSSAHAGTSQPAARQLDTVARLSAHVSPRGVLHICANLHRCGPRLAFVFTPGQKDLLVVLAEEQEYGARVIIYYRTRIVACAVPVGENHLSRLPGLASIEAAPQQNVYLVVVVAVVPAGLAERQNRAARGDR